MKVLKLLAVAVFGGLSVFLFSQGTFRTEAQRTAYQWKLPKGFPTPLVPKDNPMTDAKVELGRHLFYDVRLSINEKTSCATCHLQERAFTEPKERSVGTTGEVHPRNSMSLANVGYAPTLNWANPSVKLLERQVLTPMFGEDPVELGMAGKEKLLIERLKAEPRYVTLFRNAYPREKEQYSLNQITHAIASFVRSMVSGNSPYDKFRYQKHANAISDSAKRGEELFFSERLECFDCHAGFNMSGSQAFVGRESAELGFENNGIYNIDGKGGYPSDNTGLFEFTGKADDMGKFKVPTLRNIELTAPYMHDGSIATLEDVIEHYKAGGRKISHGEYKGIGSENPHKSSFVRGFDLTEQEKADLIAFLRSLTDREFITDPRYSNPWISEVKTVKEKR